MIFTPLGRDGSVASNLLKEAGVGSHVCQSLTEFAGFLCEGTLLAIVTEDALRSADLAAVRSFVDAQPAWSDLPFIVLTQRGGGPEQNPAAGRLSDLLRNVSFLERPFHPTTFISVVKTAKRSRDRQFEARARIEEVRESELKLNTALHAGRLGSWELDLSEMTLVTTATCKSFFGRRPDDDFGYEAFVASVHPDDRDRMQDALSTTITKGIDYGFEYRIVWPDESIHWVDMRARLVQTNGGRSKLVGVSSDVTARKSTEQMLQRMNENLEAAVAERTAQLNAAHAKVLAEIEQRKLAEDQLRQTQKVEMIGQLTGGVAHDFNNLLMAVLGNLALLRKRVPQEERLLRLIDGAQRGAERGSTLTQRMLAFARRQDLKSEPINVSGLVIGMEDLIERSVGSQIDIRLDLAANLPMAMLDQSQTELALLNLVVNARDAITGQGTITISTSNEFVVNHPQLNDGRYVRLRVTDTGIGMDQETLEKATQPFFSTKELGKGTGLGLSMVHGLANQLGGAFILSSVLNHGTSAELWLPATDEAPEKLEEEASLHTPSLGKLRILVVDDDALIAMSTADMLTDLGHQVLEATSGEDGLEILRREKDIDLVLTDFSMPKMNGLQLARAVRNEFPNVPVLMASGYAELPAGADIELPRIGKPYSQDQLGAEISKLIQKVR